MLLNLISISSCNRAEEKVFSDSLSAMKGKILFTNKCSLCHTTSEEELIGPGLKSIYKRRDSLWLYA
jgi:cytochrome c2